jgi:hypothetical protein
MDAWLPASAKKGSLYSTTRSAPHAAIVRRDRVRSSTNRARAYAWPSRRRRRTLISINSLLLDSISRSFDSAAAPTTRERQRLGRPRGLKFGLERVFVLKASQTLERRRFCGRSNRQKRHWIAALSDPVKREFRVIADWLQHILRCSCHGSVFVAKAGRSLILILTRHPATPKRKSRQSTSISKGRRTWALAVLTCGWVRSFGSAHL